LIDPGADQADLLRRQGIAFLWHFRQFIVDTRRELNIRLAALFPGTTAGP